MISPVPASLQILEVYQEFDGPKLYSAMGPLGDLWLVLWIDSYEDGHVWLYVEVTKERFQLIRTGEISLRVAFQTSESKSAFKVSVSGKTGLADVSILDATKLEDDMLPDEGESLSLAAIEIPVPLIEGAVEYSKKTRQEVFDFRFTLPGSQKHQMPVDVVARLLASFNGIMKAVASIRRSLTKEGKWSGLVSDKVAYDFLVPFPGSVGVRLVSESNNNLFGESEINEATAIFLQLVECKGDENKLRSILAIYKARSAAKYKEFLKDLVRSGIELDLTWASPKIGSGGQVHLGVGEAIAAVKVIEKYEEEAPTVYTVFARLVGANERNNTFELFDEAGKVKYTGKVQGAVLAGFKIHENYVASIREIVTRTTVAGKEVVKYELLELRLPGE